MFSDAVLLYLRIEGREIVTCYWALQIGEIKSWSGVLTVDP
jgi:hypothetical protein